MARRKQKFRLVHLLLLAAVTIWLPAVIGRLAGIPSDAPPVPPAEPASPQPLEVETVSHVQPQDSDQGEPPPLRPAPEGLVLTETLISASGKTALINGLAVREGQMLDRTGYPLRVRTILAGKVILEGDGGLYELRRQSPFE